MEADSKSTISLDPPPTPRPSSGVLLGLLAVTLFSLTFPATRVAVHDLGGTIVGLGRAIIAALLAAALLLARGESLPRADTAAPLFIVGLGVVIGFPICTALALLRLPASHAAVDAGLLPIATALMAVLRAHERPTPVFWIGAIGGALAVLFFAAAEGAGLPQPADLLLLLGVALGALGYAEGGRLARDLGGWRVICWALIFTAPLLIPPVAYAIHRFGLHATSAAWLSFAYVASISMFAGFFAWYAALARGGVARISQIQLAQPVLTLFWSALLLKESVTPLAIIAALLVIIMSALATILGRKVSA